MSVVKMSKIKLMGLSYHKEKILDALHRTGSVELFAPKEMPSTEKKTDALLLAEVSEKYDALKKCMAFCTDCSDRAKDMSFFAPWSEKPIIVSYEEFSAITEKQEDIFAFVRETEKLYGGMADRKAEITKLNNLKEQLAPYYPMTEKFTEFVGTTHTVSMLGVMPKDGIKAFLQKAEGRLFDLSEKTDLNPCVVSVVVHKSDAEEVEKTLAECGFNACQHDFDCTAAEKIAEIEKMSADFIEEDKKAYKFVCENAGREKELKILCDYYKFRLEKLNAESEFCCTQSTFILEGYAVAEKEEEIRQAVAGVTDAVFISFSEPTADDKPPTLLKNDKLVSQTEFVTEMYSLPDYREIDPNKPVFFFFMLFMGLIMADFGYGVLMLVLGIVLARRVKIASGTKKLWNVIAIGGVAAMIFGLLFNSFFGVSLPFYKAPLPNPVPNGNGTDDLMTIILLCLLVGVIQIAVGYFCKALNCFFKRDILGGIFDGLTWVIFFIAFVFAAFSFLVNYLMPNAYHAMNPAVKGFFDGAATPAAFVCIGSLALAAITAGRKEKGFGKVSKGFGAVYGLISLMSDILSYARLFGLMLSGMIIASTFNNLGLSLMSGGVVGWIFGALVMAVGHAFNIAMGVLGAYIHDSRLQYIEFFTKFYTGEGNKFTPIGSGLDYVYITK